MEYRCGAQGLEDPLVEVRLIVCDDDALFVQGGDKLVSALKSPGQRVFQIVLDLPKVIEQTNEKVARFTKGA